MSKHHFRYKNIHFGYLHCTTVVDESYESTFCPLFWENKFSNFLQHALHPDENLLWRKSKEELENELGQEFPVRQDIIQNKCEELNITYNNLFNTTIFYPTANYYTIHKEYKYYLRHNHKFIVPQVIDTISFHYHIKPESLHLPEDLLAAIHRGQATFMFFQPHEGYLTSVKAVKWFNKFADHFGFNPSNFKVVTGNLLAKELFKHYEHRYKIENKFEVITDAYFEHKPWWFDENKGKYESEDKIYHYNQFYKSLEYNRSELKYTHFLSLNRRPSDHRILLNVLFQSNPKLFNNRISLGSVPYGIQSSVNFIKGSIDWSLFNYGNRMEELIDNIGDQLPIVVDRDDFDTNFATNLNIKLQNECFINIVTETDHIADTVFLSEKIWKPIYTASPFIVIGNKGTLKKLHELGYKTFSKWWDES